MEQEIPGLIPASGLFPSLFSPFRSFFSPSPFFLPLSLFPPSFLFSHSLCHSNAQCLASYKLVAIALNVRQYGGTFSYQLLYCPSLCSGQYYQPPYSHPPSPPGIIMYTYTSFEISTCDIAFNYCGLRVNLHLLCIQLQPLWKHPSRRTSLLITTQRSASSAELMAFHCPTSLGPRMAR